MTEADREADDEDDDDDEAGGFWEGVGIDPIRITTRDGSVVTLRCYLDDAPVFLGSGGRIEVFAQRARAGPLDRRATAPRGTTWPPPRPGRRSSSRPAWAS